MKIFGGSALVRVVCWLLALSMLLVAACEDTVRDRGGDDDDDDDDVTPPALAGKLDLLLVVDNSRSMADKQNLLRLAVPDMMQLLLNPRCVDDSGVPAATQPDGPTDPCPEGTNRAHAPLKDVHIGIVTSSLGGHGADACTAATEPTENDNGHLISRGGTAGEPPIPTYQSKGFLVWDPDTAAPSHDPPGETNMQSLIDALGQMVTGAGEVGCGYEAPLEAWYRFLVDPDPHMSVAIVNDSAVLEGTDDALLQQRADFLRPDSLLAILMLTDENDCSVRDGGQFYLSAQIYQPGTNNPYHLPKPRAACATDPNDPCCRSCGQSPGDGCNTSADDCASPNALPASEDNINVRCYEQKRRFGIDFLWPVDRYVTALTAPQVTDRYGNVVANPLFSDLNPDDTITSIRDSSLVLIGGILGVPWQDVARRNASGAPDLLGGLNAAGEPVGGFQIGAELLDNGTWDLILGDPTCYTSNPGACLPTDPLMRESIAPRTGANPVTGDAVATSSSPLANSLNGHDYAIPNRDDLQYACVFALDAARDCAALDSCDCNDPSNDNPLCYDASLGQFTQTQFRAKAYPTIRELEVIKSAGAQGIVASICPEQLTDTTLGNFGYRPAVAALVERISQSVQSN